MIGKRSKYGNVKTEYNGVKYDSKAEALYAQQLDLRVRAKDIQDWKGQVPIEFKINGVLVCKYIADFKVLLNDGTYQFVDVKGVKTAVFQIKHKLLKALYPDIDLLIVGKQKKTIKKNDKRGIKNTIRIVKS